jgi:protein TonB
VTLITFRTHSPAQRLGFALLASLLLHLAVLWPASLAMTNAELPPLPMPVLEAVLTAPALATPAAKLEEAIAEPNLADSPPSEARPPAVSPTPTFPRTSPRSKPRPLKGRALNTALAELARQDFYPREAIERGIEGDVIVLLALSPTGEVLSASVATSSGHGILDAAALAAVRRIHRLPTGQPQALLPVQFRLD